jgi:hypothetical protein
MLAEFLKLRLRATRYPRPSTAVGSRAGGGLFILTNPTNAQGVSKRSLAASFHLGAEAGSRHYSGSTTSSVWRLQLLRHRDVRLREVSVRTSRGQDGNVLSIVGASCRDVTTTAGAFEPYARDWEDRVAGCHIYANAAKTARHGPFRHLVREDDRRENRRLEARLHGVHAVALTSNVEGRYSCRYRSSGRLTGCMSTECMCLHIEAWYTTDLQRCLGLRGPAERLLLYG